MNYWLVLIPIGMILVALTQLFTDMYWQKVGVSLGIAMMIFGFVLAYWYSQIEVQTKK